MLNKPAAFFQTRVQSPLLSWETAEAPKSRWSSAAWAGEIWWEAKGHGETHGFPQGKLLSNACEKWRDGPPPYPQLMGWWENGHQRSSSLRTVTMRLKGRKTIGHHDRGFSQKILRLENTQNTERNILTDPRCSVCMVYLPTSLGDFWGKCR